MFFVFLNFIDPRARVSLTCCAQHQQSGVLIVSVRTQQRSSAFRELFGRGGWVWGRSRKKKMRFVVADSATVFMSLPLELTSSLLFVSLITNFPPLAQLIAMASCSGGPRRCAGPLISDKCRIYPSLGSVHRGVCARACERARASQAHVFLGLTARLPAHNSSRARINLPPALVSQKLALLQICHLAKWDNKSLPQRMKAIHSSRHAGLPHCACVTTLPPSRWRRRSIRNRFDVKPLPRVSVLFFYFSVRLVLKGPRGARTV